jgi:hypothetical protein
MAHLRSAGRRISRIPEEFIREEIAFWSWWDTPEGELWCEMSDTLEVLLKDVGLDAKERKFVWPDAGRLDLDKSIRRINQQYPEFPEDQITEFLVFWIRSLYVPEGCSILRWRNSSGSQSNGLPTSDGRELVTLEDLH